MADYLEAGPVDELGPGTVTGVGSWAVGNGAGERFALSRRCRHLRADLAEGSIDDDGCLVCPWHGARYDPSNGEAVDGPQGVFAKVPGLGASFKAFTRLVPLRRGRVSERDGIVAVE